MRSALNDGSNRFNAFHVDSVAENTSQPASISSGFQTCEATAPGCVRLKKMLAHWLGGRIRPWL